MILQKTVTVLLLVLSVGCASAAKGSRAPASNPRFERVSDLCEAQAEKAEGHGRGRFAGADTFNPVFEACMRSQGFFPTYYDQKD